MGTVDYMLEQVLILRQHICVVALAFLALFLPVINTARAVISADLESQREYLTYWTIYTCTEAYEVAFCTLYPSTVGRYPPELKLLWIVWLTSPTYQGALRIYVFAVRPIFDSLEDHIDDTLEQLWQRFWKRCYAIGKVVLWQIAFAPQDDVLTQGLKSGLQTAQSGAAMCNRLNDKYLCCDD
jgi:hypothetical protein